MSIELKFSGQPVILNDFNKIVKLTIDSAFQDPSYRMKEWNFHCVGFGVNIGIVKLVLDKKYRLFIHENESSNNYLISYEELVQFLKENAVDYIVKDVKLKILPKTIFKEL